MVSIVIPVYNAEATLDKCIQSILAQSCADLEILPVDDGSTDSSLAILRALEKQDARIRVFTQANQGASSARNLALRHATGEYIQFVDSDDTLPPDAVGQLLHAMASQDADMVIARYYEFFYGKRYLRGYFTEDALLSQEAFLAQLTRHPNSFFHAVLWNKLYRRELIAANGLCCDPSLPWGEDFAFNMQYLRYVRAVAILETPVYNYIRRMGGLAITTGIGTLLHPIASIRLKLSLYGLYKQLFIHAGLFETYRRVLPRYLFSMTIND